MNNVRRIRTERGLSQVELAKLIRSSQSTVSGIEGGNRTPQAETLRKIAEALDVTVDDLLAEPKPRVIEKIERFTDGLAREFDRVAAIGSPIAGVEVAQTFSSLSLDGVDELLATRERLSDYWGERADALTRRLLRLARRFGDLAEERRREHERREKIARDEEAESLIRSARELEANAIGA